MRVAVVGVGVIGKTHIQVIEKSGQDLVALCDVDGEKLAAYPDIPGYGDYLAMLNAVKPDAVHICTPHYLHADMVVEALSRGIHVLCEKPLCIREADIDRVLAAERASSAKLGVCFQHRFDLSTAFAEQYCAFQKLPWRTDDHMLEHDLSRVPKVLIYAPPEQEEMFKKQVAERLPAHLHALGSKPGFIEIGDIGVTKGSAVAALAKELHVDRYQVSAIGDNTLDQDMIEWAGVGCCVKNGKEAVRAAADLVIPSQSEEGVAWFIEKYVLKDQD